MGKRILKMKTEEIAANLLADMTCDTCNGCTRENDPLNGTCRDWTKKRHSDIMENIRIATAMIEKNIQRGSINNIYTSKAVEAILKQHLPTGSDYKVRNDAANTISIEVKIPASVEIVQVKFEVKI